MKLNFDSWVTLHSCSFTGANCVTGGTYRQSVEYLSWNEKSKLQEPDPSLDKSDSYSERNLKQKLLQQDDNEIYLTNHVTRKEDIPCFKIKTHKILKEYHAWQENTSSEENMQIIVTAIKLSSNDIRTAEMKARYYPTTEQITAIQRGESVQKVYNSSLGKCSHMKKISISGTKTYWNP